MNLKNLSKVADTEFKLNTGDIYNDGNYSGKVKEINGDSIIIESQDEEGNVVDITIPKVDDSVIALDEPSYDDIMSGISDPEFICQVIEEASDGTNAVDSYVQNEDGTLDIHIKRPITQEEAIYLREVGISVGIEALNKAGWVTVGVNPISDSKELEQFIANLLIYKKANCPNTGEWSIEEGKLKNNGNVVGEVSNESTVEEAFKTIKEAVNKAGRVSDSALHTVKDSNIDDLLDKGETTIEYDPEETNPSEIVDQLEDELSLYLGEGEELPDLEVEVLSDSKITVFIS